MRGSLHEKAGLLILLAAAVALVFSFSSARERLQQESKPALQPSAAAELISH